ncbi:S8 family peptidase [Streptomyces marincola]|uniref:S8 family peptidase n=1 Tax=Streptomyces marincola TaxID=2878388 RepID=UPI001CF45C90|nr:S8 family serine peptidase [Streptomyces marincola]UCM86603.1 S8 family serine peptidase [Streptomyces marincola]
MTATVAAAALAAGWTTPATAQEGESRAPGARAGEHAPVTLITGDQVLFETDGTFAGIAAAPGRESVVTRTATLGGDTYVLPRDVMPLIADGTLDRELFNVSELSRAEYRALDGLPLIVTYEGERDRVRALDAAADRTVLEAVNGEALTVAADEAPAFWNALTDPRDRGTLAAVRGVATVSLDGLVTKSLADSVPQVGAPEAWEAGYDGTGTTIAVLDTGIDATHPDLDGQVVAARNFSGSDSAEDRDGHGTHVASTAAGGGAAPGVAPGASLLNGKVLDDTGFGRESDIIEAMQWAVDSGADIVNMSLGTDDGPGIDPMEEAVNTLSAQSDTLFVIAAGNSGPHAGTVGSPGSAAAALTVGAVDKSGALADFSSVGPVIGNAALKPDVTAPGVDIRAAVPGGGYATLSGTSMATPHVAGAAALLAQAHPDWTGERIKAALTGSARPAAGLTAFQQGTGLIDVPAALTQTVTAEPLSLGTVTWPHEEAEPVTGDLTYTNHGDTDVTLRLTATGSGPDGSPAPEGMFTLGATEITVPAHGTATVPVTADTTPGGELYGGYSLLITGTGDGAERVPAVAGILREGETAELTVEATGRDGAPAGNWYSWLLDLETQDMYLLDASSPTLRLPVGDYVLDTTVEFFQPGADVPTGIDWLVQPHLSLTEDTTVAADAADAEPLDVTAPASAGEGMTLLTDVELIGPDGWPITIGTGGALPDGVETGQVGDPAEGWEINGYVSASWARPGVEYHTAIEQRGSFPTGLTHRTTQSDYARILTHAGASVPGVSGSLYTFPDLPTAFVAPQHELPYRAEVFVDADLDWSQFLFQDGSSHQSAFRAYQAGRSYQQKLGIGVIGPSFAALERSGNTIYGWTAPFTDGAGNWGFSEYDSAGTTLYRNGEPYAEAADILDVVEFEVPADEAEYELVTTFSRGAPVASVSTEVTSSFTFTSSGAGEEEWQELPASAVRFAPNLTSSSTSPAGRTVGVPVTVEGTGGALALEVSTDGGATWRDLPVTGGIARVTNPAAGGSVSFRAEVTDPAGNVTTQTIIDAYRTA